LIYQLGAGTSVFGFSLMVFLIVASRGK